MSQWFCLLRLGPPSGCSPSPWSGVASCIPSLLAVWRQLPQEQQPRLVWAGQGESYIAPPNQLEPVSTHLWDLALIVQYPSEEIPDGIRVENLVQYADSFLLEIKAAAGDFGAQSKYQAGPADIPKTHTLPGYDRLRKMYEQDPKMCTPVHMINLLHFVPKTGRQEYYKYLEACAPALGKCGAKVAFHTNVISHSTQASGKQWNSLLIGAYPNKLALIQGVIDPQYIEAFKIREQALTDAMLLATIPVDLGMYNEGLPRSSL